MRLLIDNYLDDSTVTTTSENTSYPVVNLNDRFLEKRFQATGSQAAITVEFTEDRAVSMIAIGFNNLTSSDDVYVLDKTATDTLVLDKTATDTRIIQASTYYQLLNSSDVVVQTGELELNNDILTTYFTSITCRKVVLVFSSESTEIMHVGGVGIGDPLKIDYIDINPKMSIAPRVMQTVTDGGQSISKYKRDLENWSVKIRGLTNSKRKELVAAVRATRKPIFVDFYPLNHNEYRPFYADVRTWGGFQRDSENGLYDSEISVEERR